MHPLIGLTIQELETLVQEAGQPAYRGRQVATWIYRRGAEDFDAMTDLPRDLRARLAENYTVGLPRVAHRDAAPDETVKYLLAFADGQQVESVYLPYSDRVSVCLSSQVGCPAGCTFCATAQGGLARNLTADEIVGQLLRMQAESARRISHAVYMGMGEPLWNYEAVVKSLRLLGHEVGLSLRNLTVSTVGVVPGIRALAGEDLPITLALSLHAPDDALRAQLIPTARKWKLEEILDACAEYVQKTHRNLTFEYLLLGGVNDRPEQARALAALLQAKRLPGNVNLIPFNYVETPQGYRRPERESVRRFREELEKAGRVTTQRMTRGHAISAACGQLRRTIGSRTPARLQGQRRDGMNAFVETTQ
ncbi:MAG TPA: 23S rRNA (adenine(2503)-C(2))-methyltransferase RlmN [Chthonomonadaceae bacterium]|nr:23S rRNA (adenine(2503)-C(2))-methyltransferase RlmN [Chthonomonadaceae bacterium]